MTVEIRQTIVTPDADGDVVQLHISDAMLEDASASFVLTLSVKIGPFECPVMAHYQRGAIARAQQALDALSLSLLSDLRNQGYPSEPRPAPPKG